MAEQQQSNNRTSTSTQIRNMYSDGVASMNIRFYNTSLSFQFYPCTGNENGRYKYDMKNGQQTTVNYEGAYALFQGAKDIIDGKVQEMTLSVPCNGGSLILERKLDQNGQPETNFTISKNNVNIPFKFHTTQVQVKENGNVITKSIEDGLGTFMKTLDGYLTGINSDRHLDKLTEDYAKLQNQNNQNGGNQNYNNRNNNYRKQYNNSGKFQENRPQQGNWGPPAQNFSDYTIPNN